MARPIPPSGLLPLISEDLSFSRFHLQEQIQWSRNHSSFDLVEQGRRPAHEVLADHVDPGFAMIFNDSSDAQKYLGTPPVSTPLCNVMRFKNDGSVRHRLIQYLKASNANFASKAGLASLY